MRASTLPIAAVLVAHFARTGARLQPAPVAGVAGWSAEVRLTSTQGDATLPINFARAVAADDLGGVHAVWLDTHGNRSHVVYRRSADGGRTWGPETFLTLGAETGAMPSLAASGRRVRVVWGSRDEGQSEVYTRGSEDGGARWTPRQRLSDLPCESWVGTVEIAGTAAWVGWVDYRDGNEEEYLRRSADGGRTRRQSRQAQYQRCNTGG